MRTVYTLKQTITLCSGSKHQAQNQIQVKKVKHLSPASEVSREVANLTERKNQHTPVYGVKEFVCLSDCLLPNSTPIISGLAKQNGLKFFYDIYGRKVCLKIFCLSEK